MVNRVSSPVSELLATLYASVPTSQPIPHRPAVTLTYAQSLDGSITAIEGQSLQLSGSAAMSMTHQLRAAHDGILIGIGTVLADNPRLTTRLVDGPHPRPVILDSHLRTPLQANILKHPCPVCIACSAEAQEERKDALLQAGVQLIPLPRARGGYLDLQVLLRTLKSRAIHSLMVEGGARVITSFLAQELVDMLVLTITPRLVGGLHAPGQLLAAQPKIRAPRWINLGEDQIVWGTLHWPSS